MTPFTALHQLCEGVNSFIERKQLAVIKGSRSKQKPPAKVKFLAPESNDSGRLIIEIHKSAA